MRSYVLAFACILAACQPWTPRDIDGGTSPTDIKCPSQPDLSLPKAKCSAADGLYGDSLVCVDFSTIADQVLTSLPPVQSLSGWSFGKDAMNNDCWQVKGGKLQINTADFTTYKQNCGFLMSALSAQDFAKYSKFTLAVVHTIDISDVNQQKAQIMMGSDDPQKLLIDQTTGKQPHKQWSHTLVKSALPNGLSGPYQPLFKFAASSASGGTAQGWLIESIAVLGSP